MISDSVAMILADERDDARDERMGVVEIARAGLG